MSHLPSLSIFCLPRVFETDARNARLKDRRQLKDRVEADHRSRISLQAYALYRTRLPVAITHQALLLLSRLKTRYPSARGTSTSPHRLFLSSLMLSSKISMDDTYSNQSWTLVGQNLFTLREVNQMERELFAFLG